MDVFLTQYLLPDGRKRETHITLPDEAERPYIEMLGYSCRLEAEILSTGEVSVTVFHVEEEIDLDIEVVPNGPEVQDALMKMLKRRSWRHGPEGS